MRINERRSLWRRMRPYVTVFDGPLMLIILLLLGTSLATLYSASIGIPGKIEDHLRNIAMSFCVMWVVANISPQTMMRIAVPAYVVTVLLLVAVALVGTIKLGARRWLHIGVIDIQPSEFAKLAVPLMLHGRLFGFVVLQRPQLLAVQQPPLLARVLGPRGHRFAPSPHAHTNGGPDDRAPVGVVLLFLFVELLSLLNRRSVRWGRRYYEAVLRDYYGPGKAAAHRVLDINSVALVA